MKCIVEIDLFIGVAAIHLGGEIDLGPEYPKFEVKFITQERVIVI
jgi:hypothetical protein